MPNITITFRSNPSGSRKVKATSYVGAPTHRKWVQKTISYDYSLPSWGNEYAAAMALVTKMNATDPTGAIWALTANNTNTGIATMTRFTGGARPYSLTFEEFRK